MPQMMPINWMMIFLTNLICLFILIILINSFVIKFPKMKKKCYFIYKKWMWLW